MDRAAPDGAPPIVDPRVMRDVLGHFASGVTVLTAVTEEGPLGVTCQSLSSPSLDPPLVAFAPPRPARRSQASGAARPVGGGTRDGSARRGLGRWADGP